MSRITPRTSDSPSAVVASSPPSRTPETRAVTSVCALGTCNRSSPAGAVSYRSTLVPWARTLWSHPRHVKRNGKPRTPAEVQCGTASDTPQGGALIQGSIDGSEVQAITRASRILAALEASPGGLSLAQIAQRVELPRSTVHRIVKALTTERFLVPVSSAGGVRLGPRLAGLASAALGELRQQIRPHLERLSEQVNETVDLAVLDRDQVVAPHRLQAVSAVGARFAAHCTANGKALLAELPPEQVRALLPARLPRLTPNTITSRSKLMEELERVRETGIAFDDQEHTAGICAIGQTIPDGSGGRAALTIPLPALRFQDREPLATALAEACGRITELLASSPRPKLTSSHRPAKV